MKNSPERKKSRRRKVVRDTAFMMDGAQATGRWFAAAGFDPAARRSPWTIRKSARLLLLSALGSCLVFQTSQMLHAETELVIEAGDAKPSMADYRLGIRDKVKIQVFEWRPARDEVFTWTALNQTYAIDAAGTLSLPLIGQVTAAGYTVSELSTIISRKLANRLNLGTVPDTTVEVAEYRPIFITGFVERSGEFAFTPGMTVLQAISLGGGYYRSGGSHLRLEREFLSVTGDFERSMRERERLIVKKARIEAELAAADRIAFPADLASPSPSHTIDYTSSLMSKEQSVFELRRKAYDTQVKALDQLKSFLEQEVETIAKRIEAHQSQIELLKAELGGIKNLTDKGLATQPRLLGLQRNLAQLEVERLRMESDKTRAQQDLSRARLSEIEYENKRANDLTVELQTTEARLEQVVQEAALSEQLLVETKSQAAGSQLHLVSTSGADGSSKSGDGKVKFTIVRQIKGQTIEIDGDETTSLQPGDTVKVALNATIGSPAASGTIGVSVPGGAPPRAPILQAPETAPQRAAVEPVSTGPAAE